jgi:hypothetical protein
MARRRGRYPGAMPEYARMTSIDYTGARFLLGRTADGYAIWEMAAGGEPQEEFPVTQEGWAAAWLRYRELEGPEVAAPNPREEPQPKRPGEIIGTAFRIWWKNLRSLVAISASLLVPVYAILIPLTLANTELVTERVGNTSFQAARVDVWVQIIDNVVRYLVVTPLLTAAILTAVALTLLGRRPGVRVAYRAARGRWLSILWVIFLATLSVIAAVLPVLPFVVILIATDGASWAIVLTAIVGIIATIVGVFVALRLLFATPVLLLEGRKGTAALRRSWRLVRGLTWKVLGTTLLMGLIMFGAFFVVGIIVTLFLLPNLLEGTLLTGDELIRFIAIATILSSLVQIVAMPLTSLTTVLLYVDARVRKEGYDRGELEGEVEELLA